MKYFRSYLATLDRLATSESDRIATKKLYRTLLATTIIAGSQFLAAISATANPVPTPTIPNPLLPTRIILNESFESPAQSSNGAGYGVKEAYSNNPPIIWRTTEPGNSSGTYKDQLEIWRGVVTGPGGQPSLSGAGSQYAEINASTNASIYQDICVVPNENVGWSLIHAARKNGTFASGNPTNIMQVSITDPNLWSNSKTPPTTQLYNSGNLSTAFNQGWQPKNGSWVSTTTSIKPLRFAFQAIEGSNNISYGNFIDNVNLSLPALIDFLPTGGGNVNLAEHTEGNSTNYYYLSLRINGKIPANGQVRISLFGLNSGRSFRLGSVLKGSATATGLSATANGNQISLNIPAGTYNPNAPADYIHIPIDFSDTTDLPNDNLTFTLEEVVSGSLTIKSTRCSTDIFTVQTKLKDDDDPAFQKRVERPVRIAAH